MVCNCNMGAESFHAFSPPLTLFLAGTWRIIIFVFLRFAHWTSGVYLSSLLSEMCNAAGRPFFHWHRMSFILHMYVHSSTTISALLCLQTAPEIDISFARSSRGRTGSSYRVLLGRVVWHDQERIYIDTCSACLLCLLTDPHCISRYP